MPSHHGVKETVDEEYPNQMIKQLLERGSCRNFSHRRIPPKILDLILRAGCHSPTGGNLQPYSIIKIQKGDMKRKLSKLCGQSFMSKAPVHLLFCIDWHRIKRWAELEFAPFTATSSFRHFWISFQDTIICAQNICTAADAFGLGSVYIGTIVDFFPAIKEMFELPAGVFPVVLLCMGYPREKDIKTRRKLGPEIIVHEETYKEPEDEKLLESFEDKYPGYKIDMTDDRLERIFKVCRDCHGEDFANKCIDYIKKKGYINSVQRYFGLHYIANGMADGNDRYMEIMEESGFNWFKKFEFYGES